MSEPAGLQARPRVGPHFRLQWEDAQQAWVLQFPEGMLRVILLGDPTRALGSLAEPECRRIVAAIDLAERLGVPLEWFALSAGAKIAMSSGSETMDWIAAGLRRIVLFTQAGGELNVVVAGTWPPSIVRAGPPVPVTVTLNGCDEVEVYDRAAMDLHEQLRIELAEQALDGPVDQRFACSGYGTRVRVVSAKVADFIHGYQPHFPALGNSDPTQELPRQIDAGELIEKSGEIGWLRRHALTQAGYSSRNSGHRQRLHHVVDGTLFERAHGIFVVSGNEHDVSGATCDSSDLETRSPGHLDIQEDHIGPM